MEMSMKSIIESSAYCVILVIMCYMAIGFIQMNMDVNKVNEVSKYVQDYMEVHGKSTVMMRPGIHWMQLH